MSDLLGRPSITAAQTRRSPSLVEFAKRRKLPEADIEMLAGIRFRGEGPKTPQSRHSTPTKAVGAFGITCFQGAE